MIFFVRWLQKENRAAIEKSARIFDILVAKIDRRGAGECLQEKHMMP
jgi:hypothetical protein